jgi:hypothetical protein
MIDGQPDTSKLFPNAAEIIAASKGLEQFVVPEAPKKSEPELSSADVESYRKLANKSESLDFFRDLEWAYNNLGNKGLRPEEAPSGSAWHMLEYGRSARSEFMKQVMNYFMKKEKEKEDHQALQDDHKKQMRFITTLEEEVQGISADMLSQVSDEDLLKMVKERKLAS